MANTLTSVAPLLFAAARIVPRELTGVIQSSNTNFNDQGVAKGDTVQIPVSPTMTTAAFTAAQTFTAGTDRTVSTKTLTLNQAFESTFNMTAENERSLMNSGVAQDVFRQTVEQGIRQIVNDIETYAWKAIRKGCSRATGTAATTPFATVIDPVADLRKILDDNGAPAQDRSLIINTAAGANLRKITNLYKANEAGTDETLRRGVLLDVHGFAIRESNAPVSVTAGTGASYVTGAGTQAVGATAILMGTGQTGTILAGDVITISGDSNKYTVVSSTATGADAGVVTIGAPGLKVAATSGLVVTVGAAATANIAMHKSALCLVCRPALQPVSPVAEQMVISDPVTGLSFLMLRAVGSGMSSWYIRVVYDAFAPNDFAAAQLLG